MLTVVRCISALSKRVASERGELPRPMPRFSRKLAPWVALALLVWATGWALSSSTLPPADLTFCNGTEIKTIDPAKVTGMPEGRVVSAIFEGLCLRDPVDLHPIPGVAERWEESPDKKQYTFYLRDNAKWSDGTPVTAEDFRYSFQRFLLPETQGEYASLLWYVRSQAIFDDEAGNRRVAWKWNFREEKTSSTRFAASSQGSVARDLCGRRKGQGKENVYRRDGWPIAKVFQQPDGRRNRNLAPM